ncbi:MAG: GNAT family N-acetyltransferase [Candidatus Nitrohelix vancouverensis]|uniref:GNAT family N-acetyltransferase n=1 Tax=Candidatus Nitrohelix vancouverensis TaxID=2705534 RepID=A0A7T0C2C1_9BACT|nr:MAG: GNAT family N-acetyltransferase [Candidatus Nitrohelix vancouverensis]
MKPCRIRLAIPADFETCALIFTRAWNCSLPEKPKQVTVDDIILLTEGELVHVAERGGKVAGFISVWEPESFIHHLYVDPEFWGMGIGTELVDFMASLTRGRPLGLKCKVGNKLAMAFYRARGFVETDERGEDEYGPWARLLRVSNPERQPMRSLKPYD